MGAFDRLPKRTQEDIKKICDVIVEIPEQPISPREIKIGMRKEYEKLIEMGVSELDAAKILIKKHKQLLHRR